MNAALDVVRSLVRLVGEGVVRQWRKVDGGAKRLVADLQMHRRSIEDPKLTAAVAQAAGVRSVSLRAESGAARIDASFESGEELQVAFVPLATRFAPRGAKELSFRVEPPELAQHPRVRSLFAALAAEVARGVWRIVEFEAPPAGEGIVEVESRGTLRIDLRTLPAVRQLLQRAGFAILLEAVELRSIRADEGAFHLDVGWVGLSR